MLTQYSLRSRICDHLGLTFWVVAYGRFDCCLFTPGEKCKSKIPCGIFRYAKFTSARTRFLQRKFECFVGYRRSVTVLVKCVTENFTETLAD